MSSNIQQPVALSIFDGRYRDLSEWLTNYFTEDNYIQMRYIIECAWLKVLCKIIPSHMSKSSEITSIHEYDITKLDDIIHKCDTTRIRQLERETQHDVKAIELYIKECLEQNEIPISIPREWAHMCLTSQDINSPAQTIIMCKALHAMTTRLRKCLSVVDPSNLDKTWDTPMLAFTHGQPAIPTTLRYALSMHITRIYTTLDTITQLDKTYKFGGAIGTWAAGKFTFPDVCQVIWEKGIKSAIADAINKSDSVNSCKTIKLSKLTTQTDDYSSYSRVCNELCLLMLQIRSLSDYIRDLIHDKYLDLLSIESETGSSTMPHKTNPIHFESIKAHSTLAISTLRGIIDTIMLGEYQRDMSDSPALRSLSIAFGYIATVISQLQQGLSRICPNVEHMSSELDKHPEVIMEAIQTMCRKYNIPNAYENAKGFSRGRKITLQQIREENIAKISGLPEDERERLLQLNPQEYLGLAHTL